MGLDKWIKPEETKTKAIKKKDESNQKKKSESKPTDKQNDRELSKLTKFDLSCSNTKCKYKKTIVKKIITEKDKICPRCKSEMKFK
ncbi:MAG: hypothetical protein KGD70_00435 [Candidatus Lokiarchaeota archaeon]|nr:hypothetical protein [Candidatus Lokiarchaeota archaeon]